MGFRKFSEGPLVDPGLVGLSPQDIESAFKIELGRQQLESQRETARIEADIKREQLGISRVRAGTELYTAMSKDERTAAQKNYEYAQAKGYAGTFDEFHKQAQTSQQKNFKSAVRGGYDGTFHEWMLEMKKAGAISLGEVVARKKATTEIEVAERFRTPQYIDRVMKEELGDPMEAFAADRTPDDSKFKLRQRVRNDLKRAFPKAEITGKATSAGVIFYKDGEEIMNWTDPSIGE